MLGMMLLGAVPAYFWLFNQFVHPLVVLPLASRQFFAFSMAVLSIPILVIIHWMARGMWQAGLLQGLFGVVAVGWGLVFFLMAALGLLDSMPFSRSILLLVVPFLVPFVLGLGIDHLRVILRMSKRADG